MLVAYVKRETAYMKRQGRMNRLALYLLVVTSILGVCLAHAAEDVPKNIILFIGDGMGVSQVTAGKITKGTLNLERFKVVGLLTTFAHNALVTDSAAAGTALATGFKTVNGAISVSPDGRPIKTIVEYAEAAEKSTGIAVSCSVTHATPACFLAHVDNRSKDALIAEHIASSGIDVLFGGGAAWFLPMSAKGSKRQDEKNLATHMAKRMKVIGSVNEFQSLNDVDAVAGFFAEEHPGGVSERKPSLPELTRRAIIILSKNKNGFFLMVEGSQIDWGGHAKDMNYIISEMVDFDNAVGVGLDFAKQNPQTLVVATADHETSGFAIHDGSVDVRKVTTVGHTSGGHTAAMVPVFAYGPGSSAFAGIADNTSIGRIIIGYLQKANEKPPED